MSERLDSMIAKTIASKPASTAPQALNKKVVVVPYSTVGSVNRAIDFGGANASIKDVSTSVLRVTSIATPTPKIIAGKKEKELAEAQHTFGLKYSKEHNIVPDKKQAAECYQTAANNERLTFNYKNTLLETAQSYFGVERPQYIHFDYGPHHAKVFRCICSFHKQMTSSIGRTKIEAEQFASQTMLNKIQHLCFKQIDKKWIFSTTEGSIILSSRILDILNDLKLDSHFDVLSLYGDAVLRYVIAHYLYNNYGEFREGVLTLILAEAMREETRARVAMNLKLEKYVRSGITTGTLAETLSAVIGKLNLLSLNNTAKELILDHYRPFIDHSVGVILRNIINRSDLVTTAQIKTTIHNFKNELQEHAQKHALPMPSYHLISKEGGDHTPTFTVKCIFKGATNIGKGSTIKSAEQNAAKSALEDISLTVGKERFVARSQTYAIFPESDSADDAHYLTELKHHLDLPDFVTFVHLKPAFIHPSLNVNENYQRLEFLGDAILRMLIIDYLLNQYPKIMDKAFLSPLVDQLVSAETQTKIAKKLQLDQYVLSSAPITDNILGDVLEALIAAIYMSSETRSIGTSFCNDVAPIIINWFKPEMMKSLNTYHIATKGTIGSDNFPVLTTITIAAKATIQNNTQVRSYAAVATPKKITKNPSVFFANSKMQRDFPSLITSATKIKPVENSPNPSCVTATIQSQVSIGKITTPVHKKICSYAEAAMKKPVTKNL